MTTVTLSDTAQAFLLGDDTQSHNQLAHVHAALLPQQLDELLPWADEVHVDRRIVFIGGIEMDCLITRLSKRGQVSFEILTATTDLMSQHPLTGEWLFRGERLINEVLYPAARVRWGV